MPTVSLERCLSSFQSLDQHPPWSSTTVGRVGLESYPGEYRSSKSSVSLPQQCTKSCTNLHPIGQCQTEACKKNWKKYLLWLQAGVWIDSMSISLAFQFHHEMSADATIPWHLTDVLEGLDCINPISWPPATDSNNLSLWNPHQNSSKAFLGSRKGLGFIDTK